MKLLAGLLVLATPLFSDYTTYIGDEHAYHVAAITADAAGNTYITGSRILGSSEEIFTTIVPTVSGSFDWAAGTFSLTEPLSDVFVTKLDPSGKILFTQTFGGTGTDQAAAIALDPAGNIYVAGTTDSNDFPLVNALQPSGGPAPYSLSTSFVVKLSPDGSTLLYSTYFNVESSCPATANVIAFVPGTQVTSLATDAKGNLYVAGSAYCPAVAPNSFFTQFAFVTEINATGTQIVYSNQIAGSQVPPDSSGFTGPVTTLAAAIAVDANGEAYVAGNTNTTDLPSTSGAWQQTGLGGFVAKVNIGGHGFAYLTYLAPVGSATPGLAQFPNTVSTIAVDASGNAYISGATSDSTFPTTLGAFQPGFSNSVIPPSIPSDGFLVKLNPAGTQLIWSTYLGGSSTKSIASLAVDGQGDIWLSGVTGDAAFPNTNGWSQGNEFLAEMNSAGSSLLYAARYPGGTAAQSIALDPATGMVHAAGQNGIVSGIAPQLTPTPRVFGIASAAGPPIAGRVAPGELISIYGPHIGPATSVTGSADSNGFLPTSLGGVQVTIGGAPAPLLSVSDSEISAIVPLVGHPASVVISNGAVTTPAFSIVVVDALPTIFQLPANVGSMVLNQDGTINSPFNPAQPGSVVSIWATGTGAESLPLPPGQIAPAAVSSCYTCQIASTYRVDGDFEFGTNGGLPVLYAGAAPGSPAGVTQINFQLPQTSQSAFTLTAGNSQASVNFTVFMPSPELLGSAAR